MLIDVSGAVEPLREGANALIDAPDHAEQHLVAPARAAMC